MPQKTHIGMRDGNRPIPRITVPGQRNRRSYAAGAKTVAGGVFEVAGGMRT